MGVKPHFMLNKLQYLIFLEGLPKISGGGRLQHLKQPPACLPVFIDVQVNNVSLFCCRTPTNVKNKETQHKASSFPLDHFIKDVNYQNIAEDSEAVNRPVRRIYKDVNLLKKLADLTLEADRLVKTFNVRPNSAPLSTASSSSLIESTESGYTKQLVEKKLREATFQKQKGKNCTLTEKMNKHLVQGEAIYCQQNYEDHGRFKKESISFRSVNKNHLPLTTVQKENINGSLPSSTLTEDAFQSVKPFPFNNVSNEKLDKSKNKRVVSKEPVPCSSSPPTKLSSSRSNTAICRCLRTVTDPSQKPQNNKKTRNVGTFKTKVHISNDKTVRRDSTQSTSGVDNPIWLKEYSDACVNTEIKKPNASLVRVISSKEAFTSIDSPRLYQIQELPRVNIRPNLTIQTGPVIDIKVSKPIICKNNVSVVECVHEEKIGKSAPSKGQQLSNSNRKPMPVDNPLPDPKVQCEVHLQRIIREYLKRLENKKSNNITRLKESLQKLLALLKKVTPMQKAPLRTIDKNIMVESIDLLFTNIDTVTKLIESEFSNKCNDFCKYPECIIKAVNILCNSIHSNFVLREKEKTFIISSINSSSFAEGEKGEHNSSYLHWRDVSSTLEMPVITTNRSNNSESDFNIDTNIESPKEYIPLRKLVPGGKYKAMEEVNSLKEMDLRRLRLKKINEINEALRADFPSYSETNILTPENEENNDILNKTFIIETQEKSEDDERIVSAINPEDSRKFETEYEDDWEQELEALHSDAESSGGMIKFEVQAQVHKSDEGSFSSATDSIKVPTEKSGDVSLRTKNKTNNDGGNYAESRLLVSTSSQTVDPLNEEIKDIHAPLFNKSSKQEVHQSVPSLGISQNTLSFPIIRMTNPLTNSLLEVRFPEHSDKIQSSILVQKSEDKEEIKLLYNMNNEEKVQTWPRSSKNNDSSSKKQKFYGDSSASVGNLKDKSLTDDSVQKARETNNQSDFQHITTNFIGFLENKVSEMVKKIRSSEVLGDNLGVERVRRPQQFSGSHCPRSLSLSLMDLRLRENRPYKSTSSIVSNKSNEELNFNKMLESHASTPDCGRMEFENLISPKVVLKFKQNAMSQTDEYLYNKIVPKRCVETSPINLEPENCNNSKSKNGSQFRNAKEHQENERNEVDDLNGCFDTNLITVDTNLRLSDVTLEMGKDSLSNNRLLPLPEDVLKAFPIKEITSNKKSQSDLIDNHEENAIACTIFENKEDNLPLNNSSKIKNKVIDTLNILELSQCASHVKKTDDKFPGCEEALPLSKEQIIEKSLSSSFHGEFQILDDHHEKHQGREKENLGTMESSTLEKDKLPHLNYCTSNELQSKEISNPFFKDHNLEYPIPHSVECSFQNTSDPLGSHSRRLHNVNEHSFFVSGVGEEGVVSSCCNTEINLRTQSTEQLNSASNQYLNPQSDVHGHYFGLEKISFESNPQFHQNVNYNNESSPCKSWLLNPSSNFSTQSIDSDSSLASEEYITIHHANSDEMSDGEVRYVYTSNSYSSGEIKPIVNQCQEQEACLDRTNDNFTFVGNYAVAGGENCDIINKTLIKKDGNAETVLETCENTSSNPSMNTNELK